MIDDKNYFSLSQSKQLEKLIKGIYVNSKFPTLQKSNLDFLSERISYVNNPENQGNQIRSKHCNSHIQNSEFLKVWKSRKIKANKSLNHCLAPKKLPPYNEKSKRREIKNFASMPSIFFNNQGENHIMKSKKISVNFIPNPSISDLSQQNEITIKNTENTEENLMLPEIKKTINETFSNITQIRAAAKNSTIEQKFDAEDLAEILKKRHEKIKTIFEKYSNYANPMKNVKLVNSPKKMNSHEKKLQKIIMKMREMKEENFSNKNHYSQNSADSTYDQRKEKEIKRIKYRKWYIKPSKYKNIQ